jgi:mannosyltransferase OCH1-like enzyme
MKIPKIIHQVWLGSENPMPKEWMETFRKTYKDYTYYLWTDNNLPELLNDNLVRGEEYNFGKSDIVRYEVLYKYGGIYFDADMVCLKKIPDKWLKDEFMSAYESEERIPGLINNGFIGCYPKHPILKALVSGIMFRDRKEAPWKCYGPGYLTEVIEKYNGNKKIHESKYFHPNHWRDKDVKKERIDVAYVDHKWGTSTGLFKK